MNAPTRPRDLHCPHRNAALPIGGRLLGAAVFFMTQRYSILGLRGYLALKGAPVARLADAAQTQDGETWH